MLNHSSSNNTRIKVNAVSGTIVKNYKDSFFLYDFSWEADLENLYCPKSRQFTIDQQ